MIYLPAKKQVFKKISLYQIAFLLLFILITPDYISANDNLPEESNEKKSGIVVFPVGFYSPETSAGFGVTTVLFKEHHNTVETKTSDSLAGVLFYTLNRQFLSAIIGNKYWQEASLHYRPVIIFSSFPKKFYGIGKQRSDEYSDIEPISFKQEHIVEYRFFEKLYGGLIFTQGYYRLGSIPADGIAYAWAKTQNGTDGPFAGAGFTLSRDSRNNSLYPTNGSNSRLSVLFCRNFFISDFSFTRYNFDHASYFSLPLNSVLAFQFYFDSVTGNPPLSYISELGGQNLLRGFYQGKYSDKIYLASQIELRFPIFWRIGGVVFGAVGNVFSDFHDISLIEPKYTGGMGLRVALKQKEKINLRIDLAFNPEKNERPVQFYFNVLEAF